MSVQKYETELSIRSVDQKCQSKVSIKIVAQQCGSEVWVRIVDEKGYAKVSISSLAHKCQSEVLLKVLAHKFRSEALLRSVDQKRVAQRCDRKYRSGVSFSAQSAQKRHSEASLKGVAFICVQKCRPNRRSGVPPKVSLMCVCGNVAQKCRSEVFSQVSLRSAAQCCSEVLSRGVVKKCRWGVSRKNVSQICV